MATGGSRFQVSTKTGTSSSLTETTRFEELSAEQQKDLQTIQARMIKATRQAETLKERTRAPIDSIEERIDTLRQSVEFLSNKLERESKSVHTLRAAVREEMRHVDAAKRDFQTPSTAIHQRQRVPKQYFWNLVATFEERMQTCHARIEEVYQFLNAPPEPERHTPEMLRDILEYQTELFVSLAAQIATLHDHVQAIKQEFLEYRLERNLPDPFEEALNTSQSRLQRKKKKPLLPPFEDLALLRAQAEKEAKEKEGEKKESSGFSSGFGSDKKSGGFGGGFGAKKDGEKSSGFGSSGFGAKKDGDGKKSGFGSSGFGSKDGKSSSGFGSSSGKSGFGSSSSSGKSGFGSSSGKSGFGSSTSSGKSGFGPSSSSGKSGFGSSSSSSSSGSKGFGSSKFGFGK